MEEKFFVDDDQLLSTMAARAFNVDTALGGDLGLTATFTIVYAVIVADMGMPGMNGIQFLSKVKKSPLIVCA